MKLHCLKRLVLTTACLLAVACAESATDRDQATEEGALSRSEASRAAGIKLHRELFGSDDEDKTGTYTLTGHLPGSREGCQVIVKRRGTNPNRNSWSSIRVRPLGRSARTIEEHGPVDMGFLFPEGASGSRDTTTVSGSRVVFASKDSDSSEDMKMVLEFEGAHAVSSLKSVSIKGHDIVGERDAACEGLKAPFVLDRAEMERIAESAKRDYMRDHSDDESVESMEFQGCDLARPTRLYCDFGNDTNEETLQLIFAVSDNRVGRVLKANRNSDF